jgi:hypothetical protein
MVNGQNFYLNSNVITINRFGKEKYTNNDLKNYNITTFNFSQGMMSLLYLHHHDESTRVSDLEESPATVLF